MPVRLGPRKEAAMSDRGAAGDVLGTRVNARGAALSAAAFVVLLLGSDAPREYDGATETASLEGSWQLVALEINGAPAASFDKGFRLTFRGTSYTSRGASAETGTYRFEPQQRPAHLDRVPSTGGLAGQTRRNIYRLEGDTLRLGATSGAIGERPRGFQDEGIRVLVLKRVKE
jgi:uncharacterized protein (TIGR03067 family)